MPSSCYLSPCCSTTTMALPVVGPTPPDTYVCDQYFGHTNVADCAVVGELLPLGTEPVLYSWAPNVGVYEIPQTFYQGQYE